MSLPLAGKTVMVTRPEHQSGGLKATLESLGAKVAIVPVIEIVPPADTTQLDSALRNLDSYDWVVFTSVNGVEAVRERLQALGISPDSLCGLKLAAIGPATSEAMAASFRAPDLMPAEFVSERIADALPEVPGLRFLLARADLARKDLAEALRAKGARVDEVAAYRIVRRAAAKDLPADEPDAITLTSAEVARATVDLLKSEGKAHWLTRSALVCIGPITAAAVRELGLRPAATAAAYDSAGLTRALIDCLAKEITHA